ncbi:MAG: copper transporter [Nocardioides sp.]
MMRRALVPLIAVCTALGVGIALGGGPLSDRGDAGTATGYVSGKAHDDLLAQAKAGQKLAAATAPMLVHGKLTGKPVAIAAFPGAPQSVLDAVAGQVAAAGGTVTSTVHITGAATDPANKSLVDTLGSQMATQVHGVVDAAQPPYVRLGQLLGGAVATTSTPAAPSADAATTLATLAESKLVSMGAADQASAAQPTVQSSASLLLVVLGDHVDPTILAGIVQGAATRAHGVVVAGSTGSGLRGDLKRLRAHDLGAQAPVVATVDGDETNIGQVGAVLALAHQIAGGGGAYGASGIDGVAPLG